MEVDTVSAIPLSYPIEGPDYGSARGIVPERTSTLVRVETRDGRIGWGEAFGPPRSMAMLIEEVFADRVRGMSPYEVESLAEDNYTGLYHFGWSGLLQAAISGIDIALWDLIGQAVGEPVHTVLGGANREVVTPYASTMYLTEAEQDPAEPIEDMVEAGFEAVKIKIGRDIEEDIARTEIAREILGENGYLMVDCNGNYHAEQAERLAEAIEPYDVHWLEEPLPPEDLDGYQRLQNRIGLPLAAGEAAYARFGFSRLIDADAVDIIQPDVCKCGGLSEARLIAKMATTGNLAVSPHSWMGGVGLTASLHFAAVVPKYPHSINVPGPFLFEFDQAENALRHEILEDPLDPSGGQLTIPDEPGLGVKLNETAVDRYRVD